MRYWSIHAHCKYVIWGNKNYKFMMKTLIIHILRSNAVVMSLTCACYYVEYSVVIYTSFKEGWNCGLDTSQRKLSIKSLLAHHVSYPILKGGWNFWDLLFPPQKLGKKIIRSKIRYVHGTCSSKSLIGLCKANTITYQVDMLQLLSLTKWFSIQISIIHDNISSQVAHKRR